MPDVGHPLEPKPAEAGKFVEIKSLERRTLQQIREGAKPFKARLEEHPSGIVVEAEGDTKAEAYEELERRRHIALN